MAVALLTTLYGAFVANVLFAPIVGKLEYYTSYEVVYREIVLEGPPGYSEKRISKKHSRSNGGSFTS